MSRLRTVVRVASLGAAAIGVAAALAAGILFAVGRRGAPPRLPEPPERYACDAQAPEGAWRCVYVATDGSDANSGTLHSPLATLERARLIVRGLGSRWEGDVAILLREGGYGLQKTLTLDPADSGKNGHKLVIQPYGDERVTLSGGTPVSGWTPGKDGTYSTTDVPKGVEFRHLVVNGRRAQRARQPNGNAFHTIAAWDKPAVVVSAEGPKEPFGKRLGVRDSDARFVDSLDPAQLSKVEAFVERYSGSAILRIASVGEPNEGGTGIRYITPKSPERDRLFGPNGGSSWQVDGLALRFENSLAFLDEPGEWFLDTVGTPTLYYKPRAGEDLATATVIAPRLETLVKFQGTETNRVHDVVLRGLHLTGTTWLHPNTEGFVSIIPGEDYRDDTGFWVAHLHSAAVYLEGTERVTLERNVLHALGGSGISLYDHTKNTVVDGNAILEASGIGIIVDGEGYVGTWRTAPETVLPFPPAGKPRSSGDRITNNRIQRFGMDLWSSAAVAAAYPWDMTFEHNEVSEGQGMGIFLGWYGPWGRCHSSSLPGALPPLKQCQASTGKNRIIGNRIFDAGRLNTDGGGIYTLGHQSPTNTFADGLEIRGNHVFGMQRAHPAAKQAFFSSLYLDGDTSFTRIVDNIFEIPDRRSVGSGPLFAVMPVFLNPDAETSVPPHDLQWSAAGETIPLAQIVTENPPSRIGDNVTSPSQKPGVRETAGLLPAYSTVPRVGEIR